MTKEEIIDKISDLYQSLIDAKYEHWYSRVTMTSYNDSYECAEAEALEKDRQIFISKLEDDE